MIGNDAPETDPLKDLFGVAPFAEAIANGIRNIHNAEGTVLGITGAWGSGKSTVVNFVKHYLLPDQESKRLKIVEFNPWWHGNEEQMSRAFF